jgi:multidrug efflux system membrane fusion protein
VIDEGLSPGQQVITGGQYKVQPGSLVSTAVASSDPVQKNKVQQE